MMEQYISYRIRLTKIIITVTSSPTFSTSLFFSSFSSNIIRNFVPQNSTRKYEEENRYNS